MGQRWPAALGERRKKSIYLNLSIYLLPTADDITLSGITKLIRVTQCMSVLTKITVQSGLNCGSISTLADSIGIWIRDTMRALTLQAQALHRKAHGTSSLAGSQRHKRWAWLPYFVRYKRQFSTDFCSREHAVCSLKKRPLVGVSYTLAL